jgi:D-alanyl-D-alanine carboxypeptidase/D-alanyl-D-alanine-endopeptidase (penicillin-binding protein 4)
MRSATHSEANYWLVPSDHLKINYKLMKKGILILLLISLTIFCRAQDKIKTIFTNKILNTASYSYYAIDASTGEVLIESPQMSLVPASVNKIATTAAALEILGPEFRFNTAFGYTGDVSTKSGILKGDLTIHGGCDPAFYSQYFKDEYRGTFEDWAEKVKKCGIKRIRGNLVVDISAMDNFTIPGDWIWEDIGNYYGTGVSAMTYSDNSYDIHFSSPEQEGQPAKIVSTEPDIDGLNLENHVISSSVDSDKSVVYGAPLSNHQVVAGSIPKAKTDFIVRAASPDPAFTAAVMFRKVLLRYGIVIEGKILKRTKPLSRVKVLAVKQSPELRDLIVPLNHESINLFAEHVLREIGRAQKKDPSLNASTEALNEFWSAKGIYLDGYFPSDGSGLSRANNICPRTVVEMLNYIDKSKFRDYFYNSLPIAGESGTLKNSFHGTPLESNLRAKTGTLKRIKSLAGYFTNREGRKLIFALIINNFNGSVTGVRNITQQFLEELYNGLQ